MLGEGRLVQLGQGRAVTGEGVGVASRGRGGARVEVGSCQGRPGSSKPGARGWFWAEARRVAGQVAPAAYGVAVGTMQGS